jgi:uncharacterized protein YndB with AHSA1/START domain
MRKVELTISIDVSPEKAIMAFLDSPMLNKWWQVERSLIEKRIGGVYTLAWQVTKNGFGYVSTGIIKNYEPLSILEIEKFVYMSPERTLLGPMSLTIKATESEGKTELYLCQDGYQSGDDWDWYYDAVSQAWPLVVKSLKEFLESKN